MAIKRYELIEYDVWGNRRDGYEVNQAFHTKQYFDIDTDWDDKRLIKELKGQGIIRKNVRSASVEIGGDDLAITFDYRGRPEFELRLQE